MKYFSYLIIVATFLFILPACSKKDGNNDKKNNYTKITEGAIQGSNLNYIIYGNQNSFTTGYNKLYIELRQSGSGEQVSNAQLMLHPMMDMGSMEHSSPVVQPVYDATEKLYKGAIVFTMPSGDMGSWVVHLQVSTGGQQYDVEIPVTIADPVKATLKSFVSAADGTKFFVALIEPSQPKVGINDMEIAIFKSGSMHDFPADSSLTVTLTPEMPTMGHGSPNNENPVHIKGGHYKGKVNFTMTGLWYLNLEFMKGAELANDDLFFEINF